MQNVSSAKGSLRNTNNTAAYESNSIKFSVYKICNAKNTTTKKNTRDRDRQRIQQRFCLLNAKTKINIKQINCNYLLVPNLLRSLGNNINVHRGPENMAAYYHRKCGLVMRSVASVCLRVCPALGL